MSDITIARLNTLVTANAVQFSQELNKAANTAASVGKKINGALNAVGLGLSAAGVIAFGKSILSFGGNIVDMARDAGMGTQAFQTISAVALDSGVDMEMMAKASENLRNKLQDAASGAQPVRDELAKLHLTFEGLQSLAPEKQWEAISRAIEGSSNKQEAYNIASDLFGSKIGPRLREVFETLAKGMDAASRATDGLRVPDATLKSLDDAGDKLGRIWLQMKVIGAAGMNSLANTGSNMAGTFGNILQRFKIGDHGETGLSAARQIGDWMGLNNDAGNKFNADNGTTKNGLKFGAQDAAKTLGAEMAKGAAAYAKAHPWDSITQENAQVSKVKGMLDAFFGPIDEKEKASRDDRIKFDFPEVAGDRLSRLGLLTGDGTTKASEDKKQTSLLDGIKKELITLNQKAFGNSAVYQ